MVKHAASHVGKSAWRAWRGVMMGAVMARYPVVQAVEKSLGVRAMAARTPNRHWWSGENTKAIERILVKELGKSLPCLRYKGDPLG